MVHSSCTMKSSPKQVGDGVRRGRKTKKRTWASHVDPSPLSFETASKAIFLRKRGSRVCIVSKVEVRVEGAKCAR